jgi:hypothetical protein
MPRRLLFDGALEELGLLPLGGGGEPSLPDPTLNGGRFKSWVASSWQLKPTKVWDGTAWNPKPVKIWNGTTWELIHSGAPPPTRSTPTLRASSTGGTNNLVIPKPVGTISGDLMVGIFQDYGLSTTVGIPAGWTAFGSQIDHTLEAHTRIGYKIAGGSEPSTYEFSTSIYDYPCGLILTFSNYDATTPIQAIADYEDNDTATRTIPSVTTAYENSYLIGFTHGYPGESTSTPSGMTLLQNVDSLGYHTLFGEAIAAVGATGTRTHTQSPSAYSSGISIIINGS